MHSLPFLIHERATALTVAYIVVAIELLAIAFVRKHYLHVSLPQSLVQVTLGGVLVAGVGVAIGQG
jgi:erythrin-vacuolar iron transport family protein